VESGDAESSEAQDMVPVIAGVSIGCVALGFIGLAIGKRRNPGGMRGPKSSPRRSVMAQKTVVDHNNMEVGEKSEGEDFGSEVVTDLAGSVPIEWAAAPTFATDKKEEEIRHESMVGGKYRYADDDVDAIIVSVGDDIGSTVPARTMRRGRRDSFTEWHAASAKQNQGMSVVEAFDMGTKLVLSAVESDNAHDIEAAYDGYLESLDFFDYVLATEQSGTKRAVLEQRVKAYRQRAETLAEHLRSSQANIGLA
jgi:hypothetical protein